MPFLAIIFQHLWFRFRWSCRKDTSQVDFGGRFGRGRRSKMHTTCHYFGQPIANESLLIPKRPNVSFKPWLLGLPMIGKPWKSASIFFVSTRVRFHVSNLCEKHLRNMWEHGEIFRQYFLVLTRFSHNPHTKTKKSLKKHNFQWFPNDFLVLTRFSHDSHTILTRFSHDSHTIITRKQRKVWKNTIFNDQTISLFSHNSLTRFSHHSYTILTRFSHENKEKFKKTQFLMISKRFSCSHTILTRFPHDSHTILTRLRQNRVRTKISTRFPRDFLVLTRFSHDSHTILTRFSHDSHTKTKKSLKKHNFHDFQTISLFSHDSHTILTRFSHDSHTKTKKSLKKHNF